ncbi:MAG TPA: hydroxyisourate hydrolase [Chloroflexia bacterium]|nr:hydroxyisourate hydrolase [Chloroflexia bacterium]
MTGQLTTHVLDTAQGRPAANMAIELWRLETENGGRTLVKSATTNADGRTGAPLLAGDDLQAGIYELLFMVGDYFANQGIPTRNPPFLGQVPIRFGISDPTAHYHVPLLTSPWSYSTYRGS